MITLEKRLDLSGYFVEGDLDEMKQFSERMKGCYQIIIEPFNPDGHSGTPASLVAVATATPIAIRPWSRARSIAGMH